MISTPRATARRFACSRRTKGYVDCPARTGESATPQRYPLGPEAGRPLHNKLVTNHQPDPLPGAEPERGFAVACLLPSQETSELAELHERLDESEERAEGLPHRSRYLLIVISFLRRYLDLHAELVDEVERELTGEDAVPLSPRS